MKNQPFYRRINSLHGITTDFPLGTSLRLQSFTALIVILVHAWSRSGPIWWAVRFKNCGLVLAAKLLESALGHLYFALHPSIKMASNCATHIIRGNGLTPPVFVAFLIETAPILEDSVLVKLQCAK